MLAPAPLCECSDCRGFGTLVVLFPSNVGIRKAQRRIQANMRAGQVGGHHHGFPCSTLPGFFRTGNLARVSNRGPLAEIFAYPV